MRPLASFLAALLAALPLASCSSGDPAPPCPVMGGEVDPSLPTSTYQGKTVGFCCASCKPKFDANPAAYADKLR